MHSHYNRLLFQVVLQRTYHSILTEHKLSTISGKTNSKIKTENQEHQQGYCYMCTCN